VTPFTVGDGNVPIGAGVPSGKLPVSNAVRKSQFACPRARRKAGAIVQKSGLFVVEIPVLHAWKQ